MLLCVKIALCIPLNIPNAAVKGVQKNDNFERSAEGESGEICVHYNQASAFQADNRVSLYCNKVTVGFVTLHGCGESEKISRTLHRKY